jgi:hypothetical protein
MFWSLVPRIVLAVAVTWVLSKVLKDGDGEAKALKAHGERHDAGR